MARRNVAGNTGGRTVAGGVLASAVALLCCAGVAPVVGVLTALGAGFLLTDAVLIPLLVVALGATLWGLKRGRDCHGEPVPWWLGGVGSLVAVAGVYAWVPVAFVGFAAVVAASVWNAIALRACALGEAAAVTDVQT